VTRSAADDRAGGGGGQDGQGPAGSGHHQPAGAGARGRGGARRRGDALTGAIYRAVLDELARTSFEELSFDKIAPAAGTGKAALYRRWSTPAELVMAALNDPATGFGEVPAPPGTGTLRGDLIALLTGLAGSLGEPRGRALRPLIAQRRRHPGLFDEVAGGSSNRIRNSCGRCCGTPSAEARPGRAVTPCGSPLLARD